MAMTGWEFGAGGLLERGSDNSMGFGNKDQSNNTFGGGFKAENNNATKFINELVFANVKSIRTSTIILASFNVITAFATAVGIIWDTYARKKRNNPKFTFMASGFTFVGSPETFPLILSIAIAIQGIAFAGAQSLGLKQLATFGCALTSEAMLPVFFIVPYIHLIFGVEVAIRALRRTPFPKRSKWSVSICLAIFLMMLLATFLITHFLLPSDFCVASLFYFLVRWREFCFGAVVAIATILFGCLILIFWQLQNNLRVDPTERIAASQMVFYLAIGSISLSLVAPFFFNVTFLDQRDHDNMNQAVSLSMVAAVVVNLSGLLVGGLHLFLRSNTISTIGPKHKYEIERQKLKRDIRVWPDGSQGGGSSLGYARHIVAPLQPVQRVDSTETLVDRIEKEEELIESPTRSPTYEAKTMNPLRSNAVYTMATPASVTAMTVQVPQPPVVKTHGRKGSYSIFPNADAAASTKSVALLPATTYSPTAEKAEEAGLRLDTLKPPPMILPNGRHRRDSSMASSATVQIGLRFSNVDDMPPLNAKFFNDQNNVYNLDCPKNLEAGASKRPTPMTKVERDDGAGATVSTVKSSAQNSGAKRLPPVPAPVAVPPSQPRKDGKLSPNVYNAQSPGGSPGSSSSPRSPRKAPPAPAPRDCSKVKKADWI